MSENDAVDLPVENVSAEIVQSPGRTPSGRLARGFLDDAYIEAYLANPFAGKKAAMKAAIQAMKVVGYSVTKQRAFEIHERLRHRIDKELVKKAKDAKALGLEVLMQLATSAESESVKAQVAITLTKDLFPNVSVKEHKSVDELEKELRMIRARREAIEHNPTTK